jgi:UPF0755 protein
VKVKKLLTISSVVFFLVLLVLFGAYLDLLFYAGRSGAGGEQQTIFRVERGQSFQVVAENLHRRGLIPHPYKFRILARMQGADKSIHSGEYLLSAGMSPRQILEMMAAGRVRLHKFTVPEGYRLKQIAAIVETTGLASQTDFLQVATDGALAKQMGIEADSFEGYLFPDTYYFPKNASAEQIITAMVDRLRSLFTDQWKQRAVELGYTVHQILTLASIIEKETGTASERPIISSVFHNRLKKGMRLETDPTVIYGIKNFDGNLTRKHLATRTPYNTYKIKGLPPGPIASPGLAAIEAALYPADTGYLFFVSRKDRTHHFSATLAEHNRAIRKYQLGGRRSKRIKNQTNHDNPAHPSSARANDKGGHKAP